MRERLIEGVGVSAVCEKHGIQPGTTEPWHESKGEGGGLQADDESVR